MCGSVPKVQERDVKGEARQAAREATATANREIASRRARRARSSLISNIGGAGGLGGGGRSAISINQGTENLG
jgi:hypothetical protein